MTDDPHEILKLAGVECAEVDQYAAHPRWVRTPHGELTIDKDQADAAILALARLVAKYKWQRDEAVNLTADSEDEAMELLEDVEQGWRVFNS